LVGYFFCFGPGDSSAYGVYKNLSHAYGKGKAKGIGRKEKIQGFLFGDFFCAFVFFLLLLRYPVFVSFVTCSIVEIRREEGGMGS